MAPFHEGIDHIGAVGLDVHRRSGRHHLEQHGHRQQFHAVVGRGVLRAGCPALLGHEPAPASRPGIAQTRAVRRPPQRRRRPVVDGRVEIDSEVLEQIRLLHRCIVPGAGAAGGSRGGLSEASLRSQPSEYGRLGASAAGNATTPHRHVLVAATFSLRALSRSTSARLIPAGRLVPRKNPKSGVSMISRAWVSPAALKAAPTLLCKRVSSASSVALSGCHRAMTRARGTSPPVRGSNRHPRRTRLDQRTCCRHRRRCSPK